MTTKPQVHIGLPMGIALTLLAWFGGMAVMALIFKPQNVVAFGAPAPLAQAAAALDGELLSAGRYFVSIRTERADTVRQLYASGAWLVWPVLNGGCRGANARG